MKHYLFFILFLSFSIYGDLICEGEKNLQLINEGKITMDDLTSYELVGVMGALEGRTCGAIADCHAAYRGCESECSIRVYVEYFIVHGETGYQSKCLNSCGDGRRVCEDEEDGDDGCYAFEKKCKDSCNSSFYTSSEVGEEAIDNCERACEKGKRACF